MFRFRLFSSSDRFMSNVPHNHWNILDSAISKHMNEGSGPARKIFISFGGLFLVWLALSFGKAVYIFKTYIVPLFQ